MKINMLNNISIKKRLTLGFVVLISLMLLISIIAFKSISTSSKGFIEYRSIARITNITGRIQANMLKLRTSVKNFQVNGDKVYKKEVEEASVVLKTLIEEGIEEISNTEQKTEILKIKTGFNEYLRGFEQIVEFRVERDQSVYHVLDIQGPLMENSLTQVIESFDNGDNKLVSFEATYAIKHLLLGRLYMAKFLDNNDQGAVSRVNEEFNKMQRYLDELLKDTQGNKRVKMLKDIQRSKNTYLKTFDNLVEIINSRNDIQQNILDKIGPEIAVNIEIIKLSVKEHQDTLGPELQSANKIVIFIIGLIAILSLLISIFFSTIVLKSIIKPIKIITESAKALSKGEVDLPIDIDSKDEIGLLAESFKKIIKSLTDKANVARRIAEGDYKVKVNLLSEADMLGKSMLIMRGSLEKREEELLRSEERSKLLLNSSGEGIFGTDNNGIITFVNPRAEEILGYSQEELITRNAHNLIHHHHMNGDVYPVEKSPMHHAFTDGKTSTVDSEILFRKDGTSFPAEYSATPMEKDGKLIGAVIMFRDITHRKKAAEKLNNSEAQFSSMVSNVPGIIFRCLIDEHWTMLFISKEIAKISGYPVEDFLQNKKRSYADLIHPDDLQKVQDAVAEKLATKERYDVGYRIIRANGEQRWVRSQGIATYDENDDVKWLDGAITDITDQKLTEQEIKRISMLSDNALELTKSGFWHIDYSDPDNYYASEKAANILGEIQTADLKYSLTDQWLSRIQEADLEIAEQTGQKYQDTIDGKTEKYDATYPYLRPLDGVTVWLRSLGEVIRDDKGKPLMMYGVTQDVTKHVEAEIQLKNSEKNIQKIIETAPVGIAIIDIENSKALLVNNAMGHLFNLNPDDLLDLDTSTFYADALDKEKVLKEIQDKGVLDNKEVLLKRGLGKDTFWAVVSMTSMVYFDSKAVIVSITDVTEMKKLQLGIEKVKDIAEAATQAKSQFLASMSHEIRTPMNAVIGLSHLALQTDLDPKQYDYLFKIQSSGKALLGIINDILDFSKIEAGKLDIEESEFDLEKVVNDVATIVTYKAHEKNIELIFNINENIPLSLKGDPLRIGQILINLCNNAIKFTSKGEILIKIDLEKQVKEDIWLKFSVKDSGIGIKKEHQNKLFKSFSQADSSTTRKYGGSGLGLAICKNLTEIMGGNIWLESEYGKGSTFNFTIKLKTLKDQKITKLIPSIDLREMRVLLCDDNETALDVLANMLRSLTFVVTEVTSGKEAIKELEKKTDTPYKLVLLDWKMPEMDGLEVAEKIKTSTTIADIPTIIMVTAYTRDEIIQRVDNLNLAGLLTKPVSHSTIFDTIMHAFGKETFVKQQNKAMNGLDDGRLKTVQGARILLVEDNEINQQVAFELLESASLIIDIANNGLEAVEKANSSQHYDLVFMDIQMPVMDGITAAIEIRKNKRLDHMPIVAMTADVLGGVKEKCLAVGMNDFIAKPINPSLVFEKVVKWVKPGERDISNIKTKSIELESEIIEIPDLDGIDVVNGLNRVNNNKKLYQKLLLKFHASNKSFVDDIKEAFKFKDEELALRLVHTLKGVAGNIGANELQLTSVELERKLINNDFSDLNAVLKEYSPSLNQVLGSISEYKKIVEEKEALIQKDAPYDDAVLDMKNFKPLILALKSLLADSDMDAVSKIEEINKLPGVGKYSEQLNAIGEALKNYDFDEGLTFCLALELELAKT